MPRSIAVSGLVVLTPAAPPAPCSAVRLGSSSSSAALQKRAERELAAHFARPAGAPADDTVEATLAAIGAHHRGVLAKRFTPRAWPEAVNKVFGNVAAIAIRLDCADHPALGPTSVLETLAAERVAALVQAKGTHSSTLIDLWARAHDACDRALRAYAKALARRNARPA